MSRLNHWTALRQRRISRRTMLGASAKAGVGAAGLALVGCGDDDEPDAGAVAAERAASAAEEAAAAAVAAGEARAAETEAAADAAAEAAAAASEASAAASQAADAADAAAALAAEAAESEDAANAAAAAEAAAAAAADAAAAASAAGDEAAAAVAAAASEAAEAAAQAARDAAAAVEAGTATAAAAQAAIDEAAEAAAAAAAAAGEASAAAGEAAATAQETAEAAAETAAAAVAAAQEAADAAQEAAESAAMAAEEEEEQAVATAGPRRGGTVRTHRHVHPATSGVGWDTHQVTSGHAWHHHSHIFDRMLGFDDSAAVRPELASALEIPDDVTYLFTMRDGAIFQDGAPVDANAVQLNMERIQATEAVGLVAEGIARAATMAATDDRTWQMVNSEPFGPTVSFFQAYPGTSLLISPQNFDDVATNPVGAGAMKLVEEVPGESWTGERWDGYWDSENVHIDRYEVHLFDDDNTALNAFLNGDLDFTPPPGGIPADFKAELEADGRKVITDTHQIWSNGWFNLNPAAEGYNVFRDPRMRHAYNRAIDRDALNVAAFDGAGKPSRAPTSTESWALPGDKSYFPGHDKQMAHELMDAAGYGDGVTGIMLSYANQAQRIVTEPLNSQLREVGIDLQFIAGSFAEIVPRIIPDFQIEGGGSGPWTTATLSWESPFDPHPTLGAQFQTFLGAMYGATDGSGTGPADLSQNPNDEVLAELHRTQELVLAAAKPATQEDRIPLYAKVWEAFEENMLQIDKLQWPSAYATQGHMEGFEIIPFFGLPRGSGSKYVWLNNV